MLYQFYEWQKASLAPARMMASGALAMLDHPLNPMGRSQAARLTAAALNSFEHSTRSFKKPAFGLATTIVGNDEVAVQEQVIDARPWGDLLRFRRANAGTRDPKLLIVAPMSGHYATLLRGTVEAFLPDHDVHITDWHDARDVPLSAGAFDLDDYIDTITAWMHLLGPQTHVLAVCQPAVPVFAAVALMNEREPHAAPRSMTLIGGPIDTREAPTSVNKFATKHTLEWFASHVVHRVPFGHPGFGRRVYPGFMQLAGFMAMNIDRHIEAHWQMFLHLVQGDGEPLAAKRRFYDEYRSVMDLSSEYYLQTIAAVFKEHLLPRGLFTHRDRLVDPGAIERTALLTIEGERDDISGLGQTRAAHALACNLAPSKHKHIEQAGVGHYGLFNGKRFRKEIAPMIKAFIQTHGDARQG